VKRHDASRLPQITSLRYQGNHGIFDLYHWTARTTTLDVLHRTEAERGTVILFADRYQRGDFNLFEDMKKKLIAAGVPREQVAIVHDYKKGKEFFGLQQAMRAGRVRVLLGTTEKCGIGVNIQTRLKALIDLDLPQRPDQLEKRHGRMRRSGNTFSEVEFYRMISEPRDVSSPKAHDLQRAQLLERKQTFLSQFKSGGRMGRKIEDIAGETRLSPQLFALAKAQATGNPLALEKIKLEYEIKNLTLLARSNRRRRRQAPQSPGSLQRPRILQTQRRQRIPADGDPLQHNTTHCQQPRHSPRGQRRAYQG
jgi:hypothetical protein